MTAFNNVIQMNFLNPAYVTRLVSAKGTLLTSTNGVDLAQFPVGPDGQSLVADSVQPSGLRWGLPVSNPFGSVYKYAEFPAEQSTTVTYPTMVAAATYNTGVIAAGDYRVSVYFNWRTSNSNRAFTAEVIVDGTTKILDVAVFTNIMAVAVPNVQESYCGFKESVTLTAAAHTVEVRFAKASSGTGTVWISNIRIELFRIS